MQITEENFVMFTNTKPKFYNFIVITVRIQWLMTFQAGQSGYTIYSPHENTISNVTINTAVTLSLAAQIKIDSERNIKPTKSVVKCPGTKLNPHEHQEGNDSVVSMLTIGVEGRRFGVSLKAAPPHLHSALKGYLAKAAE